MTDQDEPESRAAEPKAEEPQPAVPEAGEPEVLRYGPPPSQPTRPTWDTPAWSSAAPQQTQPRAQRSLGVVSVMTIALVTAIVSGSLTAAAVSNLMRRGSTGVTNEPTGSSVSQVHIDESSAVITAVARVMPAVVVIESRSGGGVLGGANGTGSGFIFDPNGWILTNKHVVEGSDTMQVVGK